MVHSSFTHGKFCTHAGCVFFSLSLVYPERLSNTWLPILTYVKFDLDTHYADELCKRNAISLLPFGRGISMQYRLFVYFCSGSCRCSVCVCVCLCVCVCEREIFLSPSPIPFRKKKAGNNLLRSHSYCEREMNRVTDHFSPQGLCRVKTNRLLQTTVATFHFLATLPRPVFVGVLSTINVVVWLACGKRVNGRWQRTFSTHVRKKPYEVWWEHQYITLFYLSALERTVLSFLIDSE